MKKSLLLLLVFLPVFARGQTFTGTITSTQCFSVNVYGQGTVGINVSGSSWSGTIQPKVIADTDANATASNAQVTPYSSSTAQSTITANGDYSASVAGATWFQLCGNTVTNTATVKVTPVRLSANRNAGTGNILTSGSPTVGQPARWVDGTHVTGGLFSLDATAFPGTGTGDAADKIKQCLATALDIVPCDATGFSGTQVVTLGSTGILDPTQRGSVKFGRVTFQSTTLPMLVIGSKTVVEGFDSDGSIGTNVGDSGTDFQYTGTDPGANAAIICFGDSLGCGNSAGGGGNFHSPVSKLGADCKGTAHCVPFNNSVAQENSPVNLLSVKNYTGPGIQISNLDGTACSNCQNFFMSNVMSYEKGDFCTATTDALYVNASTFGIMIQKGTFVYNAGVGSSQSCKTTSPGEVARITSLGFNCIDCHFEANGASFLAATNGVVLGLDGNTANTVLTDASFASFGGSATLMTISNAFAQTNNSGFLNAHGGSSGALNLLNDQVVTANMPVALSTENNIGSYVIGKNGTGERFSTLHATSAFAAVGTLGQPAVYLGANKIGTNGVETFGAKLRRLARDAQFNNALISPPLAVVPAWTISTAYVIGQVVANGGNDYFCLTAGTSAGSGGPTGTGAATITDNTVGWVYFNVTNTTAALAKAPTVTTNTTQPGGLSTSYTLTSNSALFSYPGTLTAEAGSPTPYCFATVTVVSGGNCSTTKSATFYSVSFYTDAPKFAITTNNQTDRTWRVLINNQYVNLSGTVPANANPSYNLFDFTSAGGRLPRLVTFQSQQSTGMSGVYMTAIDSIWAPPTADKIRAIFVGDSITAGTGMTVNGMAYPDQVGQLLGWNDIWNEGSGGTGYTSNNSGVGVTFNGRIADVTSFSPDIVIVMGGTNDVTAGEQAAALAYLQALRAALPTTPIIVTGLANGRNNANDTTNENSISAAVTQFADSRTYFIPVITDTTAWFSGTGNVGAPSGTGNDDVYASTNSPHFTQGGYSYLAQKLADKIRSVEYLIP